jgi:hypothetical protein
VANFGRIVGQAREMAVEAGNEVRKRLPKEVGKAAAGAAGKGATSVVLGGAALALGHWLGRDGLNLLLETAGAIGAINMAVGHRGGAFDRLLKTIESVAVKVPVAETQDPGASEPEEKAIKKAAARRAPAKRRANRRTQKKAKT